jgi:hypothetical protein
MLGQFLIYPLVIFLGGRGAGDSFAEPMMFAFSGAFVAMLPSMVIDRLRLSEDWRAADLFWYVPLTKHSTLFHGTRKAVIMMLCVPGLLLIVTAGALYLRERAVVLLLLLPGIITIPLFSLLPALMKPFTPFAMQPEMEGQNSSGCLYSALFMVGSMSVAGIAALSWSYGFFGPMLIAELLFTAALTWFLRSNIDRRTLPPEL